MKHLTKIFGLTVVALAIFIVPAISEAQTLNRQLEVGSTGTDVSALQTFLAQDRTIYPQGLVTGYFGFLTKAAVANFQSRNGISAVGRVGPITLPVLNAQMAMGMIYNSQTPSTSRAPTISLISVNPSNNSATINWRTDEIAKGLVYYSTSTLMLTETLNSVEVRNANSTMTDTNMRDNQSVSLPNLEPNTTYHYMIHTTDTNGNVSVSWPSTFNTTN